MKKCLVLDLDNTLWGGIVGEDGMENLSLSLTPPGSGFVAFQQALLDHYHRGVILAINSRNNPEDAWKVIRNHPNMVLKEEHFSAVRINWNDKVQNLKELAQELNIGLDSMVFLDDDRVNRLAVRALLPEVTVPELPLNPAEYAKFLNSLGYFEAKVLTDEDKMRGNFYVTERLRKEAEKIYLDKGDFLRSLALELSVYEDDDACVSRLSQLTEKTNQFNVEKKPLTEEQIREHVRSPKHKIFYGRLQDVFGDCGVVIFAVIDIMAPVWRISTLLMSCRVFGRGVEEAFLEFILRRAREEGLAKLEITFSETEKNEPARRFVETYFSDRCREVAKPFESPTWIKILPKQNE